MLARIVALVLVSGASLYLGRAYYYGEDNGSLEDLDSVEVRPGYGHSGCWGKRISQILAGHNIQGIGHRRVKKAINNAVKDQGNYQNCWAFSASAIIEHGIQKHHNVRVELSEQYLVDCCRECQTIANGVSLGGKPIKAFEFLWANGLVSSFSYPYEGPVGDCKTASKRSYRIRNIREIQQSNEAALVAELQHNQGYSIAIVILADDDLAISLMENPTGIVPRTLCGTTGAANHAVTLVGYDTAADGTGYWVIRNSYGEGHGNGGYFKMLRTGQNNCNENAQVVYMVDGPKYDPSKINEDVDMSKHPDSDVEMGDGDVDMTDRFIQVK